MIEAVWVRRPTHEVWEIFHPMAQVAEKFSAINIDQPLAHWKDEQSLEKHRLLGYCLPNEAALPQTPIETLEGEGFVSLRALMRLPKFSPQLLQPLAALRSLLGWQSRFLFCPQCGNRLMPDEEENAKFCVSCDQPHYPPWHMAILCVVRRERRLLLVRTHRMPLGYLTAIAGFVHVGETLSDCVRREVYEETRIHIHKVRYFDSQSWCFPQGSPTQCMIAFSAEYASGEIVCAPEEIAEARWVDPTQTQSMPELPPPATLSRQLIDHLIRTCYSSY